MLYFVAKVAGATAVWFVTSVAMQTGVLWYVRRKQDQEWAALEVATRAHRRRRAPKKARRATAK